MAQILKSLKAKSDTETCLTSGEMVDPGLENNHFIDRMYVCFVFCMCVFLCFVCVCVLCFVPCDFVLPESRCKGHQ